MSKGNVPYIPEDFECPTNLLEAVYESLRKHDDVVQIYIPISDAFYITALLKSKYNIDISAYEVELALYKEGMLNNDYYGIPEWYWSKWMARNFHTASKHTRKYIVQQAQNKLSRK